MKRIKAKTKIEGVPFGDNRTFTTVGIALQALQVLSKLAKSPFPARDAYALGRVTARLQSDPDISATEAARTAAIRKHGTEKNGQISVEPNNFAAFVAEYGPIASAPISLDIPKIPIRVLENAPNMTPEELIVLDVFLEHKWPTNRILL